MQVKLSCVICGATDISDRCEFCPKCGSRMQPNQEIASPLANIVKNAMKLPSKGALAQEGQRLAAEQKERAEKLEKRTKRASDITVVLADCSGSMEESIGALNMTKYDHLVVALQDVLKYHPGIKVVAFNSSIQETHGANLPRPNGGTNLAGALKFAAKWQPKKTIIISDGVPDDGPGAMEEAERITGVVDTIYCGPDCHPAIEFLRGLSKSAAGVSFEWNGYRDALAPQIRALIG